MVYYVSESSTVQMGFCMETAGMTQGFPAEGGCDLAMEGALVEDPELRDETESMDDDQDTEVEWQVFSKGSRFLNWQRYCSVHICVLNPIPHSLLFSSPK